jgi:transposase
MTVEDWAEIRRLHRSEGMPIKAIVRKLGVSRNAVRRALAAESPPKYSRPVRGSLADAVEPQIRELLAQWPTMTAGAGAKAAWSDTAEIYGSHSRATATRGQAPPESRYPSLVTRPASMNSSRIERWSRTYLPSFT